MKKIAIISVAVLALSACSSQPKTQPGLSERFITDVDADGGRRFSYELSMTRSGRGHGQASQRGERGQGGPGGRGQGQRGQSKGRGGSASRNGDLEKLAAYRMDQALEETAYCKKGYFVIDKDVYRGKIKVKGECRS